MVEHAQALQLELRVLTGLHQGAALLLIDDEVVLGSAPQCDVVLLDEGIAPRHLHILLREGGWAWKTHGEGGQLGDVYAPDASPDGTPALLNRGSRLRVANVWLMLAGVADPWPMAAELQAWQRLTQEAAALQDEQARRAGAASRREKRTVVLVGVCLALAGALLAAFALLLPQAQTEPAADGTPQSPAAGTARADRAAPARAAVAPPAPPALAPAQLRSAAFALLADYHLEQAVQVSADTGQLRLHATLGPRARESFEQSLLALQRRFGATTRIEATITSAEATLPFRIRQVLMGSDSRVVLSDGRAMYEGDQLSGYRLVSIREGVIVFSGPRKVEVPW